MASSSIRFGADDEPLLSWRVAQSILQSALKGLTCDEEEERVRNQLFEIATEEEWQKKLPRVLLALTKQSLRAPQDATRIAEQGLQAVHQLIHFERQGKVACLDNAMDMFHGDESYLFKTFEVRGKQEFEDPSKWIHSHLIKMKEYANRGYAETSAVNVLEMLDANPAWCDLRGRVFVVLGALSQFAPVLELLKCGATVIAVDKPSEYAWDRLRKSTEIGTCGVLRFPFQGSNVGADVTKSFPELAQWIVEETRSNPATIVTVLDPAESNGDDLLRISCCIDAMVEFICNQIPETSLATFSSPADVHCVSTSAMEKAQQRYDNRSKIIEFLRTVSNQQWFQQNESELVIEREVGGGRIPLGNAIKSQAHLGRHDCTARKYFVQENVSTSEPYSSAVHLATWIQRWRIIVARAIGTYRWLADKRRHRVSANILPLYSKEEEAGLETFGIGRFPSQEIREIGTLLLIRNLRDPYSPSNPTLQLDNPLEVFRDAAVHGGVFQCAFKLATIRDVGRITFVSERLLRLVLLGALLYVVSTKVTAHSF